MRRVLIDTNIYSAFKTNDSAVVEVFRHVDYIGINLTVYGELLAGFKLGSREKENLRELEMFINTSRVELILHSVETAVFYAKIFKDLKTSGKPIPTNDIWIAATAMEHGLALMTYDKHFTTIPGLMLKDAG